MVESKISIVNDNVLCIEDARILFRNFAGREDKFNAAGRRNFCVIIDDAEFAENLKESGWNVKQLRPRDEDDEPTYYLQVKVAFGSRRKPKIIMVTSKAKVELDEQSLESLDYADIVSADIAVRPYEWAPGKISAYLKQMYVRIEDDMFGDKYEDSPPDGYPDDGEDLPF